MLFDWFTIAAQIINFLILLWLLQRFLFGPIVRVMNEREQRIEQRMRAAEERQNEADRLARDHRERLDEFECQRAAMLETAQADAERQRLEMVEQAREETDRMRTRWQAAIRRSQQTFLGDLSRRTGAQIVEIARGALGDLAEADLEKQIVGVFLERLWQLPPDEQTELRRIQAQTQQPVLFRSAFALPATQRQRIASVVDELLGKRLAVEFETMPDMICGVSLVVGGREIAWNIQSYLETLERQFVQVLGEELHTGELLPAAAPALAIDEE